MTDSSPVLERDLAYQAGLGWFGKNTCLIQRGQGSLFFIGEIYTDLATDPVNTLIPDFCGTCDKCIQACPTNAIEKPRILNAQKCISYLTIESKKVPPMELREKINDWFFGCDICQTVCPWNEKVFKNQLETESKKTLNTKDREILIAELQFILNASGKKLQKEFQNSPLSRAGHFGLKRNAIIVASNQKLTELKPDILKYQHHAKLGELANWALSILAKH
jgi:epoxyqueuosine reductase